jgi:hypothetical protein
VCAGLDLTDVEDAPNRAPEPHCDRRRLTCDEPHNRRLSPLRDLHPVGKLEPQLEAVDRRRGPSDDRGLDLLALQRAVRLQ